MATLVIRNLPPRLHKLLKSKAKEHRRSMTQEAISILEDGLLVKKDWKLPPPIKSKIPLTDEFIAKARREGRA